MDAAYWKHRCEQAEDALRRARTRLSISPCGRAVLQELASLRADEDISTTELAQRTGRLRPTCLRSLSRLHEAGLVDRTTTRCGPQHPHSWRLGHLVVVSEVES